MYNPTSMYNALVDTQDRLIESTRELLWERGYVGTSPSAILGRSGVGQGSMYHHFDGKKGLALAAITRTADAMRDQAERRLSSPGTALQRISGYLHLERAVLKGCPIGRLTQDPDVMADPVLRRPVEELFAWLRGRIAAVLEEGRARGELAPGLDPASAAATIAAVLQGGYVLARADDSAVPFSQAVEGLLFFLSAGTGDPA
jgi:TetR/AcrR family transcriptional regulator, transcriptional repressor for nem operon